MSFKRIQSNPRYEEFRETVATHRDWLIPWEGLSQALGRACATIGASGILARSAAVRAGINVVVFQAGLRGDRLAVVEGDKLDFLKKRGQS
jgi:hypothetical protein